MRLVFADRVKETSTTTGTGNFTLAGAVLGFKRFFNHCTSGDRLFYTIASVDANGVPTGPWETGYGTYGPGSVDDRLERTELLDSSTVVGGVPQFVNFPAGTKHVWLDWPARQLNRTQFRDDNGNYGFGVGGVGQDPALQKIHVRGNVLVEPPTGQPSASYFLSGARWQYLSPELVGGDGYTVFGPDGTNVTYALLPTAIALESGRGLAFTNSNLLAEFSETHRIHGGVGAPNDADGYADGTIYVRQDGANCIYRKESGAYVVKI